MRGRAAPSPGGASSRGGTATRSSSTTRGRPFSCGARFHLAPSILLGGIRAPIGPRAPAGSSFVSLRGADVALEETSTHARKHKILSIELEQTQEQIQSMTTAATRQDGGVPGVAFAEECASRPSRAPTHLRAPSYREAAGCEHTKSVRAACPTTRAMKAASWPVVRVPCAQIRRGRCHASSQLGAELGPSRLGKAPALTEFRLVALAELVHQSAGAHREEAGTLLPNPPSRARQHIVTPVGLPDRRLRCAAHDGRSYAVRRRIRE